MKKVVIALIAVICAGFYAFVLYDRMTSDKTAPEITYEGELLYSPELEPEELLKGVKAVDDKDGDVSASLTVESVDTTLIQGEAIITYVARDSSNNIGRAKRNVGYAEGIEHPQVITQIGKTEETADGAENGTTVAGTGSSTAAGTGSSVAEGAATGTGEAAGSTEAAAADAASGTDAAQTPDAQASDAQAADTQTAEAAPTPAVIELDGQTFTDMTQTVTAGLQHINAAEAGYAADADANTPFVKLLQDSLEIESGEYVNIRSLVDVAYPTGSAVTTSPFALLRMIKVDGLDGQEARVFSTPGTYKFSVYVVDENNNFKKSNTRTFTLTVK